VKSALADDENQTPPSSQLAGMAKLAFGALSFEFGSGDLASPSTDELELDLSDPLQNRIGDYQLLEVIGKGGMGVVYRAHQVSLDREVALKLLAAGPWASAEFVERFRREAQHAARMHHPNIVTIYEVGCAEALHFFSMRLVRGMTLAARLKQGGKVAPMQAAQWMLPIARAVDYAHRLGVVHLDLKPANVLLDENDEPHIADFGLARYLGQSAPVADDVISGTPSYMAPEQAAAAQAKISAATDVWGLGAILYELITGLPPFYAPTLHQTLKLVGEGTLRRPRRYSPNVPADLEAIAEKCLARDPALRYASAGDMVSDLEAFVQGRSVSARPLNAVQRLGHWLVREPKFAIAALLAILGLLVGGGAYLPQWQRAAIPPKSIAVLPFVNQGGEADRYFSEGLSDELIASLAQLRDLKVISRNSSSAFSGKQLDRKAIADKLGVATLLEGSVRRNGDEVDVMAELVDAVDGRLRWSQIYHHDLRGIFAIQSEIVAAIAQELHVGQPGASGAIDAARHDVPPSGDVVAYQATLQGNFYYMRSTAEDTHKAIDYYEQAVATDPNYAVAYAALAQAGTDYVTRFSLPPADTATVRETAQRAATTALRLAPDLPEAHVARGYVLAGLDLDLIGGDAELRRAVELAPRNPLIVFRYALSQGNLGHFEDAVALFRRTLALDPLSSRAQYKLAYILMDMQRYEEAEAVLRKAIELQPQANHHYAYLAVLDILRGKPATALADARQETSEFWRLWALALAQYAGSLKADADASLQKLIAENADDSPFQIAEVYALRKQPDEVFRWLDHANATRDAGLQGMLSSPLIAAYRDDPRYVALARQLKLLPQN